MFWGLGIAATLLLASLLTWISLKSSSYTQQNYTVLKTAVRQRREFKLPDGSIAYLGPNSQLKVSPGFGTSNRAVYLNGEAFFDVQHRTRQPFTVTTANRMVVNVLGTSFNVYSSKGKAEEVKVSTGLVGVILNGQTHFVKAGEGFTYGIAAKKAGKTIVDVREAAALQNGILYFNNSSVSDIAGKIERYYNVNVEVLTSANSCPRFSGQMKDTGIHNLLDDLAFATGLHYRIKNENRIILY
nr:FecR family protein [Mucilaginibacter sp. Bleaf8]